MGIFEGSIMIPKNFLFVSYNGVSVDLAWQIRKEGHFVKYYIEYDEEKDVGNGFIEKTDDWKKELDWADIIIFDEISGMGTIASELRSKGKLVVGGTPYTDKLEDNREFGQKELEKVGVKTIQNFNFDSLDEAIVFIKKNPGKYVFKPSGKIQSHKELLSIGKDDTGKDLIKIMEKFKLIMNKKISQVQLQKKVDGVEIAVGAFFNGNEFVKPVNINFEHKKLFPSDLGPTTAEMGTLMFWAEESMMFQKLLEPFEKKLAEESYVGYFDINCIVNESGIYPLEFTARFGYPTIAIQQESMAEPIGDFLLRLAAGITTRLKVKKGLHLGVVIVVPPFPYDDKDAFVLNSKGAEIKLKNNFEDFHIEDVKLEKGKIVITGSSGSVLVVCGNGNTLEEAQEMAYARIKNIEIPRMYYRNDIGSKWNEDKAKLKRWAIFKEFS
jgi:phosphoribosylamine---glycine ligase